MTLSAAACRQFEDDGFVCVPGLLSVADVLEPFAATYRAYVDELLDRYLAEAGGDLPQPDPRTRPFAERLAALLGVSGGRVFHHVDPALNVLVHGYRHRPDLPSAQRAELFALMRSPRLLDALESLLGSEITCSPIHHQNWKPGRAQLRLAAEIAAAAGAGRLEELPLWGFQTQATTWHTDASYSLADARTSRIANAWLPLTTTTPETACLRLVPGSHRLPPSEGKAPRIDDAKLAGAISLPMEPGDVLFFHHNLIHGSHPNHTEDELRWAVNFRYLPTGEACGRPFLPAFVARSRCAPERELRDPTLWCAMWRGALGRLATHPLPADLGRSLTLAEAAALSAEWRRLAPDPESWARLATAP